MTDFADIIEPVARLLLGEPNRAASSKTELRYGARGSLAVDLKKGTWFDHETGIGGGTLDLITRETGIADPKERGNWMDEHGFKVDRDDEHRGKKTNGSAHFNIVKTYDYVDEVGKLLFQVCRLDPKDFRQRKPDPKGRDGWSWSVRGVRNVPYRLPEVLEALANGQTVFEVEGEKDADNLWRIGVPATCNAGGAGKWREELNEYFRDADVVVIEDNDPQKKHPKTGEPMCHEDGRPILPGQDHARAVAEALSAVALRVRVLKLKRSWPDMPLKGDVSDWLAAGHTREELDALVHELPTWDQAQADGETEAPATLPLINILLWEGVEPRPRRWVVRERIPARNVTLLTGQGGIGKTLLMQQLSVATVLGRDWIGEMPEFGPVLFITAEDDEDEMHFRYAQIAKHYKTSFTELAQAGLHLMSLAGKDATMAAADNRGIVKPTALFETLRRTVRELRPRWVGLDTAADIFVCNERDRSEVRQCVSLLRGVCLDFDTSVILLAHPSLSGISSGSGLSGSTAWHNSVRSRMYLKTDKKKEGDTSSEDDVDEQDASSARVLEFMKSNYSALALPVRLVWKDGLLVQEFKLATSVPERAALEKQAKEVFLTILTRFNSNEMTASHKKDSRNFAPRLFASEPESRSLAPTLNARRRLFDKALDQLLADKTVHVDAGPKSLPPSKRALCLYRTAELPLEKLARTQGRML